MLEEKYKLWIRKTVIKLAKDPKTGIIHKGNLERLLVEFGLKSTEEVIALYTADMEQVRRFELETARQQIIVCQQIFEKYGVTE